MNTVNKKAEPHLSAEALRNIRTLHDAIITDMQTKYDALGEALKNIGIGRDRAVSVVLRADPSLSKAVLFRAWDVHHRHIVPEALAVEQHLATILFGLPPDEQRRALRLEVPLALHTCTKKIAFPLLSKTQARQALRVANGKVNLVPLDQQLRPKKERQPALRFLDGQLFVGHKYRFTPKAVLKVIPLSIIEEFVRNTPRAKLAQGSTKRRSRSRAASGHEPISSAVKMAHGIAMI